MKSKYLITGGLGFIGSHLVEALVKKGERVRIVDNLSTGKRENIAGFDKNVEVIIADIRDKEAMEAACADVDYLCHLAAMVSVFDSVKRPMENHDINITGTLNMFMAAKNNGVGRVVLASSCSIYGDDPILPKTENMTPAPASPYALAKLFGEQYGALFSGLYGLSVVNLRFFNVYGPRQDPDSAYSGVISRFTDKLKKGEQPQIFGNGEQSRDFIYVLDVVKAILLFMHKKGLENGETINVGTGKGNSLLTLLATMGRIIGVSPEPQFFPPRQGDVMHSYADINKAKKLDFVPDYDLEKGLYNLMKA